MPPPTHCTLATSWNKPPLHEDCVNRTELLDNGERLLAAGLCEEALEAVAYLLNEPGLIRAQAALLSAQCQIKLGRYRDARNNLEAAKAAAPKGESVYINAAYLLGRLWEHSGFKDRALREYEEVARYTRPRGSKDDTDPEPEATVNP